MSKNFENLKYCLPVIPLIISLLVIIGWLINSPLLIQISPSWVPMQFNTALCILLSSVSLLLLNINFNKQVIKFIAAFLLFISTATLIQYIFGIDLKIDQLFLDHYITTLSQSPGRMAPNTAISFTLISIAIFLNTNQFTFQKYTPLISASLIGIGLASLISYFGEFDTSIVWSTATKMALHTAISVLVIGMSLILIYKQEDSQTHFNIAFSSSVVVLQLIFISTVILAIFKTESINDGKAVKELKYSIAADLRFYKKESGSELVASFLKNKYQIKLQSEGRILLDSLPTNININEFEELNFELNIDGQQFKITVFNHVYNNNEHFTQILVILFLVLLFSSTSIVLTFYVISSRNEKKFLSRENIKIEQLLVEKKMLLEIAPTAIITLNEERIITDINKQSEVYFEYKKHDLIGVSIDKVFPKITYKIKDNIPSDLKIIESEEFFAKTSSDKYIPFDVKVAKMDKEEGGELGYIISAFNLSDEFDIKHRLKQINKELKIKNEDLESFAFIASHDLKEPLRGIGQLIEWIEKDLNENNSENFERYFNLAKDRISRLLAIQSGLLAYSKIDKVDYKIENVNLKDLVINCFDLVNSDFNAELIITDNININISAVLIPFEQIITNILSNCIKHNDKSEVKIYVDFQSVMNGYNIQISDNGPGIPEQFQEKVFGIFKTIKSKDENLGSGIGLAIVQKSLTSLGGSINIVNDGRYSVTFEIFWPAKELLQESINTQFNLIDK